MQAIPIQAMKSEKELSAELENRLLWQMISELSRIRDQKLLSLVKLHNEQILYLKSIQYEIEKIDKILDQVPDCLCENNGLKK